GANAPSARAGIRFRREPASARGDAARAAPEAAPGIERVWRAFALGNWFVDALGTGAVTEEDSAQSAEAGDDGDDEEGSCVAVRQRGQLRAALSELVARCRRGDRRQCRQTECATQLPTGVEEA